MDKGAAKAEGVPQPHAGSITEALTHAAFLSHQIIISVMLTVEAHMGCFCTTLLTVDFITTSSGQMERRNFEQCMQARN